RLCDRTRAAAPALRRGDRRPARAARARRARGGLMAARAAASGRSAKLGILEFIAAPPAPLPSLVVLYGKEHSLADGALGAIVAAVTDEATRELNVDAVDAGA